MSILSSHSNFQGFSNSPTILFFQSSNRTNIREICKYLHMRVKMIVILYDANPFYHYYNQYYTVIKHEELQVKDIAHIWELGGGTSLCNLLQIPLSSNYIQ